MIIFTKPKNEISYWLLKLNEFIDMLNKYIYNKFVLLNF